MSEVRFKNRHRLSKKEIKSLELELIASTGFAPFSEGSQIDVAERDKWTVILDSDEIVGIYINDRPFPTIRGLLRISPACRYITVDMGAVKFVVNGADVMAPGIVEADEGIKEGDIVWVRDEKYKKPISVGIALMGGSEMSKKKQGKAVKNIHFVGDEIWNIGQA
ncbi:MAG TPA: RNA-binding protein [Thermoplasmata archaeon]|nr:RNA-binding protein [Thermoplasmata archaeon]